MTKEQTFSFTIEQIKDIFRAGIQRGEDEATAFDWGTRAWGNRFDGCVDIVHDIVNENKQEHIPRSTVENWLK